MNTRITPKTNLVPVVKGVSDPVKGLIFRTYHVRPEQLQKSLQLATTVSDKIHISKITNYTKLEKTIHTKDITYLRNMFPKNSDIWPLIVIRNTSETQQAISTSIAKQKLLQSVYAYILTQNAMFPIVMKENALASIKSIQTSIKHTEHIIKKPQLKHVTEQVSLKPHIYEEFDELLKPVVLPITLKSNVTPIPNHNISQHNVDYGIRLVKNKVTNHIMEHIDTSKELSAFINFINPSPIKVFNIFNALKGKSGDNDSIIKNLILKPQVYKYNTTHWSDTLSTFLADYWKKRAVDMDDVSVLYNSLILRNIDQKKFKSLHASYNDSRIHSILTAMNIDDVLNSNSLSIKEQSLFIASLDDKTINNNKQSILNRFQELYYNDEIEDALLIFSAYANHLSNDVAYRLLNTFMPTVLSINNILNNVLDENIMDGFSYLLLQVLSSITSKTHYVPYSDISIFKETPFIPVLLLKVLPGFLHNKIKNFQNILNTTSNSSQKEIEINLPIKNINTKDRQLFIRMLPIMVLNKDVISTPTIKGKVPSKNILIQNDKKVLVYNPMECIQF